MRIAFPIMRASFLKGLGSVIDEALRRGHDVVILTDPAISSKPGEEICEGDLIRIWPAVDVRRIDVTKAESVEPGRWDALVGLDLIEPRHMTDVLQLHFDLGVPVYSVSDLYETALRQPGRMNLFACTFYVSDHQRWMHRTFRAEEFAKLDIAGQVRTEIVGCTYTDQRKYVSVDQVRNRLGLPASTPVVTLMTLKMRVPEPFRRFAWGEGSRINRTARAAMRAEIGILGQIWRGPHYRDIVQSLRSFCDSEGACLIGKSRLKNNDPPWMRDLCDVYVSHDEVEYPYTSMQLLAISGLCVHFESGAAQEAAHVGVRSVSLRVPQDHLMGDIAGYTRMLRSQGPGSIFNTEGVVDPVPYAEFEHWIDKRSLADLRIDDEARAAYVASYLGYDDHLSGSRIMDVVEVGP